MRRAWMVVAVAVCGASVAGCTSPDLSPVPQTAEGPYACAGVPRTSAELLLGGSVDVRSEEGTWGGDFGEEFRCLLERGEGEIIVREEINAVGEDRWEGFASGGTPIEADSAGRGLIRSDGDSAWAGWACDERVVFVSVASGGVDGRDVGADTEALLVSMLPWACGGEEPPGSTET